MEHKRWQISIKTGQPADCHQKSYDTPFEALGRAFHACAHRQGVLLWELRETTKDGQPCYQLYNGYNGLAAEIVQKCDVIEVA